MLFAVPASDLKRADRDQDVAVRAVGGRRLPRRAPGAPNSDTPEQKACCDQRGGRAAAASARARSPNFDTTEHQCARILLFDHARRRKDQPVNTKYGFYGEATGLLSRPPPGADESGGAGVGGPRERQNRARTEREKERTEREKERKGGRNRARNRRN